jgi:hypothetical protein
MAAPTFDLAQAHRWFAIQCNNLAWQLAEQADRTPDELEDLISAAHASRYHWSNVGTRLNALRCESLLAMAYLCAGRAEISLHHAQRSHSQCQEPSSEATPFDRACAVAGVAAALAKLGHPGEARLHYVEALAWVEKFDHPDEKPVFEQLYPPP